MRIIQTSPTKTPLVLGTQEKVVNSNLKYAYKNQYQLKHNSETRKNLVKRLRIWIISCKNFESVMWSFLLVSYINYFDRPDLFLVLPFIVFLFNPNICRMIIIILLLVNPYFPLVLCMWSTKLNLMAFTIWVAKPETSSYLLHIIYSYMRLYKWSYVIHNTQSPKIF